MRDTEQTEQGWQGARSTPAGRSRVVDSRRGCCRNTVTLSATEGATVEIYHGATATWGPRLLGYTRLAQLKKNAVGGPYSGGQSRNLTCSTEGFIFSSQIKFRRNVFSVGESDAGDCVTFPASCGFRVNNAQYFLPVSRGWGVLRSPHFLILQPCTRVGAGGSNPARRTLSHFVRADSLADRCRRFESLSDRTQPRKRDVVLIVPRSFSLVTCSPRHVIHYALAS